MNASDAVKFHYSVRAFLIQHQGIESVDAVDFQGYVDYKIAEFWAENPGFSKGRDVPTLVKAFEAWHIGQPVYEDKKGMGQVTVSITKHYGAVSVTYGLSKDVELNKGSDFFEAKTKLQAFVEKAFEDFEANELNRMGRGANSASAEQPAGDSEYIKCDRISVKIDNGKKLFRAHGGRWQKFGVPLYPEVFSASGLEENQIPDTGLTLNDATMRVDLKDGKPVRVSQLSIAF